MRCGVSRPCTPGSSNRKVRQTPLGFGDADGEGPKLLAAVKPATAMHIWELDTQELANTAWAFATPAVEDSELQEAVKYALL